MLKRFFLAAGILLVATLAANEPASAFAHRASYGYGHHVALHGYQHAKGRTATRGRFLTKARFGYARRAPIRNYRLVRRGGTALVRRGQTYRLARRSMRFAAARRDTTIRNYVGPRSAYTPVSTPAAGGTQVGSASYYGGRNHTASGGFVGSATCAHRSLPFGTRVLVTNLANSRQAVLTVNDRGPFVRGRIVDVSTTAAGVLGMLHSGTAPVRVTVVGGRG